MTDISLFGDASPVAAALLKQVAHDGVEIVVHPANIAKLCALGKQHIASRIGQVQGMKSKSLNQVLAERLAQEMAARGLSAKRLGELAEVAPNTVSNYLKRADPTYSKSGKEQSAKLAEVERIAAALGLHALSLLTDPEEQQRRAQQAVALLLGQAAPEVEQGKRRRAA